MSKPNSNQAPSIPAKDPSPGLGCDFDLSCYPPSRTMLAHLSFFPWLITACLSWLILLLCLCFKNKFYRWRRHWQKRGLVFTRHKSTRERDAERSGERSNGDGSESVSESGSGGGSGEDEHVDGTFDEAVASGRIGGPGLDAIEKQMWKDRVREMARDEEGRV